VSKLKRSKSKTALIVLLSLALLIALGGAALLFFAMENDYDSLIRHFEFDSVYAISAFGACVCGFILAVAGFFSASKKLSFDSEKKYSFVGTFISVLTGLMCLLYFVMSVKKGLPETKKGILLAELTFAALSAIFFFLKASGVFAKKPLFALSGLLPALMSAFILLNLYFSSEDPLNAPLKIYETVMLATYMLYFTAEAGIAISRPKMNKKFAFAGIFATATGGMTALSRLAVRIADVDTFDYDIITVVFHAALWLYILISFAEKLFASREIKTDEAFFDNETDSGEQADAAQGVEEDAVSDVEETLNTSEEDSEKIEKTSDDIAEKAEETEDRVDDIFEKVKAEAEKATELSDKSDDD